MSFCLGIRYRDKSGNFLDVSEKTAVDMYHEILNLADSRKFSDILNNSVHCQSIGDDINIPRYYRVNGSISNFQKELEEIAYTANPVIFTKLLSYILDNKDIWLFDSY